MEPEGPGPLRGARPVLDPAAPWGGFGSSGYGQEMGHYAIDAYTEVKSVWVNLA